MNICKQKASVHSYCSICHCVSCRGHLNVRPLIYDGRRNYPETWCYHTSVFSFSLCLGLLLLQLRGCSSCRCFFLTWPSTSSTLLVHSASPHLAKHVKPCWLSCRVVCRHCGTLCSPKYKILGKSFTTIACRWGDATQRGMWMSSFSHLVFDGDLVRSLFAWIKLKIKEILLYR